ncbi:glycosyl transferase family 1, partial [Flavobacterium bomense]
MILFSHPTLNANAKALINGLHNNNFLFKLYTCIAIFPGQLLFKLGEHPKLKDLKRRSLDRKWQSFTRSKSFYEFGRLLASKLHLDFLLTHEKGFFCIERVYQNHDKWVANKLVRAKKDGIT